MTAAPAVAADHAVQAGDVRLHVEERGSGPPVLLLHGFPDDVRLWDGVVPALVAAGRRTIAYDQRGFGRSTAPRRRSAYAIDRIVADAIAVLDALGVDEPVDVVGHDWGALVGWALCAERPERVRRHVALCVGHPRAYATAGLEQKRKGLYVGGFQLVGLAEWWLLRDGARPMREWAGDHPGIDEAADKMARPGRLRAALSWYRTNLGAIFFRRWGTCRVPTMGVHATRDRYLAEDQLRRSARYMEAAWRLETVDSGHWLPLEQPQLTAQLVLEWLDASDAAGSVLAVHAR